MILQALTDRRIVEDHADAGAVAAVDKAREAGGEVHTNRFEGNKLVIMNSYAEGAVRMVVSFDPAFSTCTVDVVLGKESGGTIKRRGLDGVIREIVSYDVTNKTCTIRDGNPFAN